MLIKICDRCKNKTDETVILKIAKNAILATNYFSLEYDLCKECYGKFKTFMKGAKDENRQESI